MLAKLIINDEGQYGIKDASTEKLYIDPDNTLMFNDEVLNSFHEMLNKMKDNFMEETAFIMRKRRYEDYL